MNYKKYSDMMTDQSNYSVRSQDIEDSFIFILLNINFLDKILSSRNMTSKWRRIDVDATSSPPIDVNTTLLQRSVPAGLSSAKKKVISYNNVMIKVKAFMISHIH